MRVLTRNVLIASAFGIGTLGSLGMGLITASTPARAQISVFDPTNYSQNLLTAARTLTQINNQIQSLQNEAAMLINQSKNLARIDFPQLQQLTQNLQAIDRLMGQAQGIDYRVDGLDRQFNQLFPKDFDQSSRVVAAKARLDAAMAGFRQAMSIQSQIVTNVQSDAGSLREIVAKSQGAEGGLQAQQATNQLLALTAKQQFQIQSLMAAQYRVEATEAARRAQAAAEGRAATKKFLGTGQAYTDQ